MLEDDNRTRSGQWLDTNENLKQMLKPSLGLKQVMMIVWCT